MGIGVHIQNLDTGKKDEIHVYAMQSILGCYGSTFKEKLKQL